MRKEIYKIKNPKHIVFGRSLYFEDFKGAELKTPHRGLQTAQILRCGPACPAGEAE